MIDVIKLTHLLIFTPLFCAIISAILKIFAPNAKKRIYFSINAFCSFICLYLSAFLFQFVITYKNFTLEENTPILVIKNIVLHFGFYLDNLSITFLLLTTFLFTLGSFFSYEYLRQNPQGIERFFILFSLLEFFAISFFVSSNLIQSVTILILISVCKYLFSNFYFQKPIAQKYSKRIFQTDIVAQSFLLIATIALLFFSTLTPDLISIPTLGYNNINSLGLYSFAQLTPIFFALICLFFTIGILIKCAQLPFCSKIHYLSQTPNTALSTILMLICIGCGVFLIARIFPILNLMPINFEICKIIGATTAILAGLIALRETEIKKILTFGGLSFAGVIFMSFGFKIFGNSIFYFICSALAFSLISFTLDTINNSNGGQESIKFLGGLRRKMPLCTASYLIGAISLCGVAFGGIFPIDAFLNYYNFTNEKFGIFVLSILGVISTFWIFRLYFRVFEGKYKGSYEIKKIPKRSTFCLVLLSSIVFLFGYLTKNFIKDFLYLQNEPINYATNPFVGVFYIFLCLLTYYVTYKICLKKQFRFAKIRLLKYKIKNRFGFDTFLNFFFETMPEFFANLFSLIEKWFFGGFLFLLKSFIRFFSFLSTICEPKKAQSKLLFFISLIIFIIIFLTIYSLKAGLK